MPDPKSRARVERLLSGTFRPDDLTGLFLYARDHCDGRESVTEIGHFVAHHDERNKGIVTRSTREWFATARFHMWRFQPPKPVASFDAQKMPSATREYFKIAVNRIGAQAIRKEIGVKGAQAFKIMNDLAERLSLNADGSWSLPNPLTPTEGALVNCVCSSIVSQPAFEADRLCEDFFATLKSNGLIMKDELAQHKNNLRNLVQLYAISAMHNCVVQVGDGTTTQLKARADQKYKNISVDAGVPDAVTFKPNVTVASSMFYMEADPADHCHPDLLKNPNWDFEIELNENRQLARLG